MNSEFHEELYTKDDVNYIFEQYYHNYIYDDGYDEEENEDDFFEIKYWNY